MKKGTRIALFCAAMVLLTSAACGTLPQEQPAAQLETPAPTPAPTEPEEVIAVVSVPTPASALPTVPPTPVPTPEPTEIPITAPVITLIGGEHCTVDAAFTFTDPGFFAVDYLQNNLTARVKVTGEVVPYLVGTYALTYAVTDDDGRTTELVREVEVVPVEMPEIVMPPEKTVYLTFDDGPCGYTETLLDVLKKYDAKATFFVIGNKGRKDIIKRAYEEGHSIGVHTYTHEYKKIYKNEQAFFDDFLQTQEVIKEQTGSYTRIFRFPGGSANTVSRVNKGIMTRLTKIMEDMGYRYFDWNVSAGDSSGHSYTSEDVKNRVVSGMKNHGDFAIVLQHDIHLTSVRAVESILEWGTKHGYTFLGLDLTSPYVHSKVQN